MTGAHLGEKVVREKEYRSAMTAAQIQAGSFEYGSGCKISGSEMRNRMVGECDGRLRFRRRCVIVQLPTGTTELRVCSSQPQLAAAHGKLGKRLDHTYCTICLGPCRRQNPGYSAPTQASPKFFSLFFKLPLLLTCTRIFLTTSAGSSIASFFILSPDSIPKFR